VCVKCNLIPYIKLPPPPIKQIRFDFISYLLDFNIFSLNPQIFYLYIGQVLTNIHLLKNEKVVLLGENREKASAIKNTKNNQINVVVIGEPSKEESKEKIKELSEFLSIIWKLPENV